MQLKVIGIDPGFRNTGIATATLDLHSEELRDIKVKLSRTKATKEKNKYKSHDDLRCAKQQADFVQNEIIRHGADLAFAEMPSGGARSSRATWALGLAVGILTPINIPLFSVTPRNVKLVTGDPNAEKEAMIKWAINKDTYLSGWLEYSGDAKKWSPRNEHMADALATIHAGLNTPEYQAYASLMSSVPIK